MKRFSIFVIFVIIYFLLVFSGCSPNTNNQNLESPSPNRDFFEAHQSAKEAIKSNRNNRYFIVSSGTGSMNPWFNGNAFLIMQFVRSKAEINVGDIIDYYGINRGSFSGKLIIHQVISKEPIETKGLANNSPDIQFDVERVKGRLIGIRYFDPQTAPENPDSYNSKVFE